MDFDTLIIGGGLAGLSRALQLQDHGGHFSLIEADPVVGGRVRSDHVNGYTLDRGFQVFLDSYPAFSPGLVKMLKPRFFDSGALLLDREKCWVLRNPLRHPFGSFSSLRCGALSSTDKSLLVRHALRALTSSDSRLLGLVGAPGDVPLIQQLRSDGVSPDAIERFLRPFFGGVFLDPSLSASRALYLYYLKKFATGRAFVPSGGVGELPRLLAARLAPGTCRTGVAAESITPRSGGWQVTLNTGEHCTAKNLVLATDPPTTAKLLNQESALPDLTSLTTIWFSSDEPLYPERLIALPAGRGRLVRHFVQMTNVAPEYAPPGKHLLTCTILEPDGLGPMSLIERAKREVCPFFPSAKLELVDLKITVPATVRSSPGRRLLRDVFDAPPGIEVVGDNLGWSCLANSLRA